MSEKPTDADGEEMRALAYSDELPSDLVAYDFVIRGAQSKARRAFLLEYCKEEGQRDLKTQRALDKGKFLHDDNLLALKPRMKPLGATN